MRTSGFRIGVPIVAGLLCAAVSAQVTSRVSIDSSGAQADEASYVPSISADGRYVAFYSPATNLVPGNANFFVKVYVRDTRNNTTERISVDSSGTQGDGDSMFPTISADGRYVAFWSYATNLVPGDTNATTDIFVRDRLLGTTERVSIATGGAQGNGAADFFASISADGRYVAFVSNATNLVSGDTNGFGDVFVRDRHNGTTERVSISTGGTQGDQYSGPASISADGRYLAFYSRASNLVPGDTNGVWDAFVRDRQNGTTERVSVDSNGAEGNGTSGTALSLWPSISADGRYVAFESLASNLAPGDTNGHSDVFVHDRTNHATERVSIPISSGGQVNGPSTSPSMSADGRYVGFWSDANDLVQGDTNGYPDSFIRDRQSGTTERVSVDSAGTQADRESYCVSVSAQGRYVAFQSNAANLVPGDTNGSFDIFVRDRNATHFTSLCDPGTAGIIACPCSNPPLGANRGCDNSSITGGAILSASGRAYLSGDSLVFTSIAERPTATSIVLQGNAEFPSGHVFGQGVRCAGGLIKRLFMKTAVAGSITAPDFGAGDPTVSARSAALGDVILGGQSRWYLVYYRDPNVLGGCPASSTFNATQTGQISWSP